MKIRGLSNNLLFWLLVSGALHAAALWGAGGWGDFSAAGTGTIEVSLAPAAPSGVRGGGAASSAAAGAAAVRPRPPAPASTVPASEKAVAAPPVPEVSAVLSALPPLDAETAAPASVEAASPGDGQTDAVAPEGHTGGGDGAGAADDGAAGGAVFGETPGNGPSGGSGRGGLAVRTPPRCIEMRQPAYPREARRRGLEGEVKLRLVVARDGRVREARVVESSGHDLLDRAARETAGGWKFHPARLGPAPVEDDAVFVTVAFELDRS